MPADLTATLDLIRQQLAALLPDARARTDLAPQRVGPGLNTTVYRSGVQQGRLGRVRQVTVQILSPLAGTDYVTGRQIDQVADAAEALLDWLVDADLPLLVHWPTGVTAEYSADEAAAATIIIPLATPEEYGKI